MLFTRRYLWIFLLAAVVCWAAWLLVAFSQRRVLAEQIALGQLQTELQDLVDQFGAQVTGAERNQPTHSPWTRAQLQTWWETAGRKLDLAAAIVTAHGEELLQAGDFVLPRGELPQALAESRRSGSWQKADWRGGGEASIAMVARPLPPRLAASLAPAIPLQAQDPVAIAWAFGRLERDLTALPVPIGWGLALPLIGLASLLLAIQGQALTELVRRFARSVVRISAGDLEEKIDADKRQGIGVELSEALDQLTARLLRRQASEESDRDRTAAVLASMVEGVLAVDHELRITMANAAATQMLALPRDFVGKYVSAVVRIPLFEDAILHSRRKNGPIKTELETVGAIRRVLSMRVTPLRNHPSAELAIVLHDVTDLRRLETMRRDFVANVSHELKTPLASIKAFAETLRLGAIDDPKVNRQFLTQIETQTQLLEQQILDLLHLARVESGQTTFELVPVDLNHAAVECVERFRAEAAQRDIDLRYVTAEQPVLARADREALGTVLDNLMSNAIRYTKGGGKVEIRVGSKDGLPFVAISDTGIGIAEEHHDRIFERFYRVDHARSRDVGGTGLGLAIVKHTVQALGGRIGLTSRLGKGSTFQVFLPAAASPRSGP